MRSHQNRYQGHCFVVMKISLVVAVFFRDQREIEKVVKTLAEKRSVAHEMAVRTLRHLRYPLKGSQEIISD